MDSTRGVRVLKLGALLAALLTTGPGAAAPPDAYSAAEIRGRVVDAETQRPIEGVHVVAQWILETGLIHSRRVTRFHIMETLTDATGEYYFPAWGPKPRPFLASLDTADPRLTFFKPGYVPLDRSNAVAHDDPVRTSRWHGKTIELQPFRGSPEEWVWVLTGVQGGLAWGRPTDDPSSHINDYWKHFPRIVLAIVEQRRLLPESLRHRVSDVSLWEITEGQVRALVPQESKP